jgi:hypothetical protein
MDSTLEVDSLNPIITCLLREILGALLVLLESVCNEYGLMKTIF